MPDHRDPMDVQAAVDTMNAALRLQYRSVLSYTLVAGSLTGFSFQAFSGELAAFARSELEDARHLVEKVVTLEGEPTTDVPAVELQPGPEEALRRLIELETEAVNALQAVIPNTGQEGRSEALEHRLEHMIMRKQEQIDALIRASRSS